MSQILINIVTAELAGDYRLHLTFDDGKEQTVDFKPFLTHARHPDIRAYLDLTRFSAFRIEGSSRKFVETQPKPLQSVPLLGAILVTR